MTEKLNGKKLANAFELYKKTSALNVSKSDKELGLFKSLLIKLLGFKKLYLIILENNRRIITAGTNKQEAYLSILPGKLEFEHSCRNDSGRLIYNHECRECRLVFEKYASEFNLARIFFLGWAKPDHNEIISV